MQVIEVLPADTYRVAELASDGTSTFATTAHASQLKSWKVLYEEQSDLEDVEENSEGQSDTSDDVDASGGDGEPNPVVTTNDSGQVKRSRNQPRHFQYYVLD